MSEAFTAKDRAELIRGYLSMLEEARNQADENMRTALMWRGKFYKAEEELCKLKNKGAAPV
jgi:hypothetical protein